jgi:hypothetical protein
VRLVEHVDGKTLVTLRGGLQPNQPDNFRVPQVVGPPGTPGGGEDKKRRQIGRDAVSDVERNTLAKSAFNDLHGATGEGNVSVLLIGE